MSPLALLYVIAMLGVTGWLTGRARAAMARRAPGERLVALPIHHGSYVALATLVPAALFLAAWAMISPALVTNAVLETPAARQLPATRFERAVILSAARDLGAGRAYGAFNPLSA